MLSICKPFGSGKLKFSAVQCGAVQYPRLLPSPCPRPHMAPGHSHPALQQI